ncbi:MAG: alpha/beta hydrolase, partial [Microthrixaceae bacterium]
LFRVFMSQIQSQLIDFTVRTGMTIAAESWGNPAESAVLLVHGGGQTRHSWGGTAEILAEQGWYAASYDQRGHGYSARPTDKDYSTIRFAEDLVDVCEELRKITGSAPVVVGASLGGQASLLAEGILRPGCCSAIVLVDITPRMEQVGVDRILQFMLERAETGFGSLEEAADAIAQYQPHRRRPADMSGLAHSLRLDSDGRWRWRWDPNILLGPLPIGTGADSEVFIEATLALTVPTLLIRGRMSDLVSEETAQEFLDLRPDAKFVDVSGAGHMVAGDKNDHFTSAIEDFLNTLA